MYTDENGKTHYDSNETVDRVVRYVTTHVPHIVTAIGTLGILVTAVKINKQLKNTDGMIEGALRAQDNFVKDMRQDILDLTIQGVPHTFYPGLGVLVQPVVDEMKEIANGGD